MNNSIQIFYKKLSPSALLPKQANNTDAGHDLYSAESGVIPPHGRVLIKTNIAMEIPDGFYGHICDRSGLAYKSGMTVLGGIIDSGYRGDIGVVLLNTSDNPFYYNTGDRIAQIIFKQCFSANFIEVDHLENTDRGTGGFGHTGTS